MPDEKIELTIEEAQLIIAFLNGASAVTLVDMERCLRLAAKLSDAIKAQLAKEKKP